MNVLNVKRIRKLVCLVRCVNVLRDINSIFPVKLVRNASNSMENACILVPI